MNQNKSIDALTQAIINMTTQLSKINKSIVSLEETIENTYFYDTEMSGSINDLSYSIDKLVEKK